MMDSIAMEMREEKIRRMSLETHMPLGDTYLGAFCASIASKALAQGSSLTRQAKERGGSSWWENRVGGENMEGEFCNRERQRRKTDQHLGERRLRRERRP